MILKITLSKTAQGDADYMQVMSDDVVSVNIVLVAERIDVEDGRPEAESASAKQLRREIKKRLLGTRQK